MYIKFFKRFFDIIFSCIALILLTVPMLIVAVLIKAEDNGPVLFKQKRIGLNKTYFNLYKFRSMKKDAPNNVPTHLLKNPEQYILKIGSFIRKTSIDELPQLWNILKGDMSFIGPRPALWNQYDLIAERDKYGANNVRPGLSGWAQINGRDELEIPLKAKFDGEYVEKMGFIMDVKCFLGTFKILFNAKGVVEGDTKNKEEKDAVSK